MIRALMRVSVLLPLVMVAAVGRVTVASVGAAGLVTAAALQARAARSAPVVTRAARPGVPAVGWHTDAWQPGYRRWWDGQAWSAAFPV